MVDLPTASAKVLVAAALGGAVASEVAVDHRTVSVSKQGGLVALLQVPPLAGLQGHSSNLDCSHIAPASHAASLERLVRRPFANRLGSTPQTAHTHVRTPCTSAPTSNTTNRTVDSFEYGCHMGIGARVRCPHAPQLSPQQPSPAPIWAPSLPTRLE